MKKYILSSLLAISMSFASTFAWAECEEIGSPDWDSHYIEMSKAISAGTNEIALQHALQLELMCKTDPVLLYSISEIYNRMGREQESNSYVRRASENLRGHADLPQAVVEKIWFRRATLELPMRQELAEAQAENVQLKEKLESQTTFSAEIASEELAFLEKLQWTGTGLAAGGAAIAVVGSVLFAMSYNKLKPCTSTSVDSDKCEGKIITNSKIDSSNGDFGAEKNKGELGVGLLGAGAAIAVGGSILAIISHVKKNELEIKTTGGDVTFNFDVSPAWSGITVNF
ncbi:MAG: hypothetical protein IIY06_09385 [Proteobacteria bacterium]|jgi:transposase-like protein|nr:hypothetical protein [Pseudomonadota bacterium]